MANYLGTLTGNTGIPSLLISNLSQIQDAKVQQALYQIQNWANSFRPLMGFLATQGFLEPTSDPPSNAPWTTQFGVSAQSTTGAGTAPIVFPEPFPDGIESILVTPIKIGTAVSSPWTFNVTTYSTTGFTLTTSLASTLVGFSWLAIGY